jgi:hypothetical protein
MTSHLQVQARKLLITIKLLYLKSRCSNKESIGDEIALRVAIAKYIFITREKENIPFRVPNLKRRI